MKKFMTTIIVAGILLFIPTTSYLAVENTPNETDETITVFADITGWRYKTENGITYKRLYNYSKNTWIGNWERV